MAKVTFIDGTTIECEGASIEQIYDQIKAAKSEKPPSDFIKCGGKYIRHDQIKIVGREIAPDDDDKSGWPVKVTIEGVQATVRVKDK